MSRMLCHVAVVCIAYAVGHWRRRGQHAMRITMGGSSAGISLRATWLSRTVGPTGSQRCGSSPNFSKGFSGVRHSEACCPPNQVQGRRRGLWKPTWQSIRSKRPRYESLGRYCARGSSSRRASLPIESGHNKSKDCFVVSGSDQSRCSWKAQAQPEARREPASTPGSWASGIAAAGQRQPV